MAQLVNSSKNTVISKNLLEAKNFWQRSKGLLGESSLAEDTTLWIHSCKSIHTFFMKFNIDAVFVDKDLVVKSVYHNLKPWRLTPIQFGAQSVFEFTGGVIQDRIQPGDQLDVGA